MWELAYKVGVDFLKAWKPYAFPAPLDVAKTLMYLAADNTLGIAVLTSMERMLIGYGIALIIGLFLAVIMVKAKYLNETLRPLILGLQTLPSICWIPFAILWFGIDESAIIFVIVMGSAFAIALAIEGGIKNINPLYLRAAQMMGAKGLKGYFNVVLPAALPTIISGMKQGWSFAWRALMAGEMLAAAKGLGQVLMVGRDTADMNQVVAVMIIIIILGTLVDKVFFGQIEGRIRVRWGLDR